MTDETALAAALKRAQEMMPKPPQFGDLGIAVKIATDALARDKIGEPDRLIGGGSIVGLI